MNSMEVLRESCYVLLCHGHFMDFLIHLNRCNYIIEVYLYCVRGFGCSSLNLEIQHISVSLLGSQLNHLHEMSKFI